MASVLDMLKKKGYIKDTGYEKLEAEPAPTTSETTTPSTAFTPSKKYDDLVTNRGNLYDSIISYKPFTYSKQTEYGDLVSAYKNRDPFKFDLNEDAIYQQYLDKYTQQGKLAMMDTMGQAAAMTGGYGNTYAQSVGQQAYQGQLQNVNDIVPELYSLAYSKYRDEGNDMLKQIELMDSERTNEQTQYNAELAKLYDDLILMDSEIKTLGDKEYADWLATQPEKEAQPFIYRGMDGDKVVWYDPNTGKEFKTDMGVSPYTGAISGDISSTTNELGETTWTGLAQGSTYRPNNIGGKQVIDTGYADDGNTIYATDKTHYYVWDEASGKYIPYEPASNKEKDTLFLAIESIKEANK